MSEQDTVPGTPGPWATKDSPVIVRAGRRCIVAYADHGSGSRVPEARANARLIAAAPALYNALRELSTFHRIDPEIALARARALLRAIDPEMRPWPMREEKVRRAHIG